MTPWLDDWRGVLYANSSGESAAIEIPNWSPYFIDGFLHASGTDVYAASTFDTMAGPIEASYKIKQPGAGFTQITINPLSIMNVPSLYVDPLGNVHVAFAAWNEIRYGFDPITGGANHEAVTTTSSSPGRPMVVADSGNDNIHIAWTENSSGIYAHRPPALPWIIDTTSFTDATIGDIAVDSADGVHVVYRNNVTGQVMHAYRPVCP